MEMYMAIMSKLDKWLEQKIAGWSKLSNASIPETFTLHPAKKHKDLAHIFLATQKENFEENKTAIAARIAEKTVLKKINRTLM